MRSVPLTRVGRNVHEGLPAGASVAENEAVWQPALARLAALVED